MKMYQYKIQWLFSINGSFTTTKSQERKNLYQVIRALGSRSLTVIYFRDSDDKIVGSYNNMVMYGYPQADQETIKAIKKALKDNANINSVELIRN